MRTKILPKAPEDTQTRILDVAERLIQTRGYNGFSYADVSEEMGISKASLHHHFATKAKLGCAIIVRYTELFGAALQAIDQSGANAIEKLDRYAKLYEDVLSSDRLCLCGMLAAEYSTLPPPMRKEVRRFFDSNEAWLASVLEQGRRARLLHLRIPVRDIACMLLAALEGAMLVARPFGDASRFKCAVRAVMSGLTSSTRPKTATRAAHSLRMRERA